MDCHLVLDLHLVEFVDATDAVVGQEKGAGLNGNVTGLCVAYDTGGETGGCGCLAVCVYATRDELVYAFQKL